MRCGSNPAWSPIGATASEAPAAGPAKGKMPSRTSSHCGAFVALHYAGCTSKPDAHIKSAFTCPNGATRWSVRPFTSATSCARGASRYLRRGSCCTRPALASATRSPASPSTSRRRRPRISSPFSNRWGARVATSSNGSGTGTIRSALGAVVEAIRSAYGANPEHAEELADSGHDLHFLERTAPLLEFLWSRYFRVRLLGIEN